MNLGDVARQATLLGVDLIELHMERGHGRALAALEPPAPLHAEVKVSIRQQSEPLPTGMIFLSVGSVTWTDDAGALVARAVITFRLVYDTPMTVPMDVQTRFGVEVVSTVTWPFFRERIRAASVDMNLSPFILPMKTRPQP